MGGTLGQEVTCLAGGLPLRGVSELRQEKLGWTPRSTEGVAPLLGADTRGAIVPPARGRRRVKGGDQWRGECFVESTGPTHRVFFLLEQT